MKPVRILLLEDSPFDAELTLAALAEGDIETEHLRVDSQSDFVSALGSQQFDIILADYALPSYDGISALSVAHEIAPETPFIFVSGTLGEELAIESLKRGATDYVVKQRLVRLAPAVERALRETEERRERQRAQEALRTSEENFRLLIETVQDYAIFMLDLDGMITSWNAGAERILGFNATEALGTNVSRIFTPEDNVAGMSENELQAAAAEGRATDERWHVRKNGDRFWASGVVTALYAKNGALRGFSKIMRDMTQWKRAELDLKAAIETAEAANQAKDQFLAVLSHELRTPLTPVVATIQAIEEQAEISEETKSLLEIVRRNVELEIRLIDDLLDLTRIAKGKVDLSYQTVDAHEMLRHVLEICKADAEAKNISIDVQLNASLYHVSADPARLQQVFWNLLKNAIKFTPGGGDISITAWTDEEKNWNAEFRDTGIGIEASLLSRIFNAFEQGEGAIVRKFGGLGLGLAISNAIVDMHGGKLAASSEGRGKGSTFRITMRTVAAPHRMVRNTHQETMTINSKDIKILIVDDHKDTGMVMRMLLERKGYRTSMAHSVQSALDAADKEPFDLLVSDIGLPDGTGHDLMRLLRERGGETPGIALSGFGMEDDIQRSIEAGFSEHLIKPVNFDRLQQSIEKLIASSNIIGRSDEENVPKTEGPH